MNTITASMQHNADTIERLSIMQYRNFSQMQQIIQLVIAALLILIGIRCWNEFILLPILCLFIGCWMFTAINIPPKYRARKICRLMNGDFPYTQYKFMKNQFILQGSKGQESVPYQKLIRLVEDKEYLYLYISRQSAYMIDKSTISTSAKLLKKVIADGSMLRWSTPGRWSPLSLPSIIHNFMASRHSK